MAERKTFSRYNMRCGIVLRAQEGNQRLDGFELPELDSRFLLLRAQDIPGENALYVMGTKIPLLADNFIAYKGQPLLVLFGPDYESTELMLEKIKVITSPMTIDLGEDATIPSPLFFSWGLDDEGATEKEKQNLRKVESSFSVDSDEIVSYVRYEVSSWIDNNEQFHTQCPTQWPELVKSAISSATHTTPEDITIHTEKYLSHYDEFLFTPALFGAFTAIACEKTKLVCEMRVEAKGRRTKLNYQLTTWVDEENRPKHEEVTVTIDQGAYAINGKEVQRQIIAGIIPKYSLDSFKALIRTESSPNMPTLFAGASIYSFTTSSQALHISRLAKKAQTTPLKYLLNVNKDTTKFTDWAPKHDLTDLNNKLKNIAAVSDYERKWSSSSLHSGEFGLQGYLYGIGLSSVLSIAGFSTSYAKESQAQAQISYTIKKNITISGTIPQSITTDRMLKDIISQYFIKNNSSEPVLFLENYSKSPDSGPNLLSSYDTQFLTQLMKAANKLSSLMAEESTEDPIDLKFNSQNLTNPCEFEYSGFGSAVAEIVVPKTSLCPCAKKLWLDTALALPYTKSSIQRIKTIATETLSSLGARFVDNFSISVKLTPERKEVSVYSSLENTTRALVTSAYISALWQALGEDSSISTPMGAKEIMKTLSKEGKISEN